MNGVTTYRLLEESDSAAAADLLARNKFFFGSLDPALSASRYDLLQRLKGLIFGVCAEMDGEIIAMLCTYKAGADRTANPHQVFVSALLVDAAHRTRLYSFMELYRLMLRRVADTMPWVRELLMEVYCKNLPSLYMQRMFGSVIVDGTMPNPEEIFIHNYAPAIQRFFLPMWESTHQKMETALLPFDKKKVKEATQLKDGRFVPITYVADGTTMEIYCNFYSGCVCRVRSEKLFFAGLGEKGIFVENLSDNSQSWTVRPHSDTGVQSDAHTEEIKASVQPGQRILIPVPEALSDVILSMDDSFFAFHLGVKEDWTADPYNPEPANLSTGEPFSLKRKTGLLTASHGEKVCFQELWPYLTSPYLFGTVIPDPERRITIRKEETRTAETSETSIRKEETVEARETSIRKQETETVEASETRHGFRMERRYTITPDDALIATSVVSEGGDEKQFDPVFALHLEDMDGSCEFCLKNGEVIRKTFDYVRDLKIAHDEVIMYEFVQEDYAAQEEERIILHFAGSTWKVTTDRPFRAYLHGNYIFLRPLPASLHPDGWEWKEERADFGTIRIEKLS